MGPKGQPKSENKPFHSLFGGRNDEFLQSRLKKESVHAIQILAVYMRVRSLEVLSVLS